MAKVDASNTRFSVITPCYNANRWIRCCVNSVADQEGVSAQHLVQDGLSTDGAAEYLLADERVQAESSKDKGMYDALNKAWARATGQFVIHLNADEQLLPGALEAVVRCFGENPSADVVLTGTLICNSDGKLNCYRKPIKPPMSVLLTSHQPVLTCSIFLRRSAFLDREWLYDPRFRVGADVHLLMDIVRGRKKMVLLDRFTSAFMLTGTNLGLVQGETAVAEYKYQLSLAPSWMRAMRRPIRTMFHLRKFLGGHYSHGPLEYDVYQPGSELERTHFVAEKPTGIYRPYEHMTQG
jgi:glycosyltransferase involved in cell wall biosynthesis